MTASDRHAQDARRLEAIRIRAIFRYGREQAATKGVAQVLMWLRDIRIGARVKWPNW